MVKFDTFKTHQRMITQIAMRAYGMNSDLSIMHYSMDVTACHCNGCPLDLKKLLKADDFNFAHDVFGIVRHLDRKTGKLTRCFVPRTSKPRTKLERKFARV